MAKDASQELTLNGTNWNMSCSKLHQDVVSSLTLTENVLLDETIEVVKEKVWSFRNACRGFAEVLCRIGVSPTVVGYSSVPLHEDDYVKEQDEGMLASQKVDEDEAQRESYHGFLDRVSSHESVPEEDNLLQREEAEEEDVDHGFVESTRKELEMHYSQRANFTLYKVLCTTELKLSEIFADRTAFLLIGVF